MPADFETDTGIGSFFAWYLMDIEAVYFAEPAWVYIELYMWYIRLKPSSDAYVLVHNITDFALSNHATSPYH